MTGRFAIDTNVALYAFSVDDRSERALAFLNAGPKISVQLLNEFANVGLRKHRLDWRPVRRALAMISALASEVVPLTAQIHNRGMDLAERYQLAVNDALMLASALSAGCEQFLSEDMQHGLLVEDHLHVINPFLDRQGS